ncbi:hypothetical protein MBLNU230_g3169t1 [Neophaeotheca triangularis]
MVIKHDAEQPSNIYASNASNDIESNVPTAERDGAFVPIEDDFGYKIREQPYGTKRPIKVILMGAGASTLNFLKQAEEQLQEVKIVVYEKNADVGGTWLENRYPGCACDIPSVCYEFSWKTKLWSHYYSFSPEILEYLKEIEKEHNFIEKYIKLRHQIERVHWDTESGQWRFKVKDLTTGQVVDDAAEFFINAGGVLNNWKWPELPGLDTYEGKLMHSANYDTSYSVEGKRVAVIGAGSSGVQIVANIQPKVEQLYHWVRSPIWITAGFAQSWAGKNGANFAYTPSQLQFLKDNPKKHLEYRKQIENELNQRFRFIIKGSQEAQTAREFSHKQMAEALNHDSRLCDKIIPKTFNPGCRRPTPAPGYLQALVAPNTTIFTDPINRITPAGFLDHEGTEHPVDAIICATGFDTTWQPRFPFLNGASTDLRDFWSSPDHSTTNVTSYLSIGIPTFPNHFSFCGPYGPLGHGSFMPLIEQWTRYMLSAICKCQEENIKALSPRLDISKQFRQHADLFLKRTAWTSPCRSWFKQGKADGQAAVYPGSRLSFLHLLSTVRYEDYEIEYWDGNRFAFLGNGFDTRETDGRDVTDYLGSLDGEGVDRQPEWDTGLVDVLAGWAVGK